LPYSQAQPRKDVDRAGKPAMVYDVVFHPDTLYMAEKNARFKRLVVETACDAVSQAFSVAIDKSNLKFPKMVFKGTPQPTLIRKKRPGTMVPTEPSPLDKFYPPVQESQVRQHKNLTDDRIPVAEYAVPKYQITHRRDMEYHELTEEMDAKLNVLHPKELVVTIELPLLSSTKDVNLDVTSEKLVLASEAPAKYKLELKLPCAVLEHDGTAKFDKDTRKLVIVLPVAQKRKNLVELMREDSGVECSVDSVSSEDDDVLIGGMEEMKLPASPEPVITETAASASEDSFLNPNLNYQLPNFNLSRVDNFVAFTLHVKNVDPDTVVVDQKSGGRVVHVKFCSIGAGFYPAHYAFYLEIPSENTATITDVTTEAWDNNLIVQLELDTADCEAFHCYAAGPDPTSLISYEVTEKLAKQHTGLGKAIEDDSLSIPAAVGEDKKEAPVVKKPEKKLRSMSESYCDELKIINELECLEIESAKRPKNKSKTTKASKEAAAAEKQLKQKMRSISESSGDEHVSTKPSTGGVQRTYKSILKKRCSYDRSMSECSMSMDMDHYSSSMDYGSYEHGSSVTQSHDSDFGGSLKKTVRFNDKIRRQLFR
jgi:dynein assembly factor 2, axonemal